MEGMVLGSEQDPLAVTLMIRLAQWKKNSSTWKYEFKQRHGIHDKIYKWFIPKMGFDGYRKEMNAVDVSVQTNLKFNDAYNDYLSGKDCEVKIDGFFLGATGSTNSSQILNNLNVTCQQVTLQENDFTQN